MRLGLRLLIGLFALTSMQAAVADEPRAQRIQIEAEPPGNPELQEIYDVLKQRQWLEKNTRDLWRFQIAHGHHNQGNEL
jgi:hypothetical protein